MQKLSKISTETGDNILTVDAIRDFQVCELYYKYKFRDEIQGTIDSRTLWNENFESTLKRIATYFFYKKQGNAEPSYASLLNRWEKLWFPKDMTSYDLAIEKTSPVHGGYSAFSNIATASLERFYETFCRDDRIPVLIDEDFLIPLSDEVRLKGSFDLILLKDDEYTVVKWFGRRGSVKQHDFTLDFAALKAAFGVRSDNEKIDNYVIYDLASANAVESPVFPTDDDVSVLKYWGLQTQKDEREMVPRRGFTSYCKGCRFDKDCKNWNEWPENE